MQRLTISGNAIAAPPQDGRIYCPALKGLSPAQADLAFVLPRMDHNRVIRETPRQGEWAALLASDPFGSETALFSRLSDLGYHGVTNWPSSILLDGTLKKSMATVPASPLAEYEFLKRAMAHGFETMAFFRSVDQAREALKNGIERLVLHPGLLDIENGSNAKMVRGSLQRLIEEVKSEARAAKIYAYTSAWHESLVGLKDLDADGLIWLDTNQ